MQRYTLERLAGTAPCTVPRKDRPGRVVRLAGEHLDLDALCIQRRDQLVDAKTLGPEVLTYYQ